MPQSQDKIYRKVTAYLMKRIASGEMKPGEAIYSENELCRLLQVSRTSVRRAIREMVEKNILESRQGAGTFLRRELSPGTVCLINHHSRLLRYTPLDSYYTDLIYGAEQRAMEEKCPFQIFSGIIAAPDRIVSQTLYLHADAILLDGNYQDFLDDLTPFQEAAPHVLVLDGSPEECPLPSLAPDFTPSFRQLLYAAGEQTEKGILFLYEGSMARRRWTKTCFENAARQMSFSDYVLCDYSENTPRDLLKLIDHEYLIAPVLEEFFSKRQFGGIICDGDRTAMIVEQLLLKQSYRIPQDIVLSGAGGVQFSALAPIPLTTIKVSSGAMGAAAVDLLLKAFKGEKLPNRTLFPTQVIRRDSFPPANA